MIWTKDIYTLRDSKEDLYREIERIYPNIADRFKKVFDQITMPFTVKTLKGVSKPEVMGITDYAGVTFVASSPLNFIIPYDVRDMFKKVTSTASNKSSDGISEEDQELLSLIDCIPFMSLQLYTRDRNPIKTKKQLIDTLRCYHRNEVKSEENTIKTSERLIASETRKLEAAKQHLDKLSLK